MRPPQISSFTLDQRVPLTRHGWGCNEYSDLTFRNEGRRKHREEWYEAYVESGTGRPRSHSSCSRQGMLVAEERTLTAMYLSLTFISNCTGQSRPSRLVDQSHGLRLVAQKDYLIWVGVICNAYANLAVLYARKPSYPSPCRPSLHHEDRKSMTI